MRHFNCRLSKCTTVFQCTFLGCNIHRIRSYQHFIVTSCWMRASFLLHPDMICKICETQCSGSYVPVGPEWAPLLAGQWRRSKNASAAVGSWDVVTPSQVMTWSFFFWWNLNMVVSRFWFWNLLFLKWRTHLPISLWNLGTVQILIGLNSDFRWGCKVSVGYVECPTQLRGSKRPQKDEGNGGNKSCWQYDTMHGQHMVPWVELYPN